MSDIISILIVDDSSTEIDSLVNRIKDEESIEFSYQKAFSINETNRLLNDVSEGLFQFDIALVDISLGFELNKKGLELAATIRKHGIPVILITMNPIQHTPDIIFEKWYKQNDINDLIKKIRNIYEMKPNRRIFIIYSFQQSNRVKDLMKFLTSIGMLPQILGLNAFSQIDIAQQLRKTIDTCQSAIIFLTADDRVIATVDDREEIIYYPRQNVTFEWGYVTHKIEDQRVFVIRDKKVNVLSDMLGGWHIHMANKTDEEWYIDLHRELYRAGLPVTSIKDDM